LDRPTVAFIDFWFGRARGNAVGADDLTQFRNQPRVRNTMRAGWHRPQFSTTAVTPLLSRHELPGY